MLDQGYEPEIAKVGGKVSAWTSREMTVFSATVRRGRECWCRWTNGMAWDRDDAIRVRRES